MKSFFWRGIFFSLMMVFIMSTAAGSAGAEGLLKRNSGQPSDLEQQELDDAYYRGYNDAKIGKDPVDYTAGPAENNGEIARGAGRGALGGAAMGNLSGGDAGKGAAWGAGAGAIKGAIKRKRAAEEENAWAAELSDSYNKGYHKGMTESAAANVKKPAEK
jgi:hypothetical protein